MKIIGQMNSTLTVQMSSAEFSDLVGNDIDPYGNVRFRDRSYSISQLYDHEFKIREGWERLHLLNANTPELQKTIRQLRAIADVLEPLELVVCPELEEAETAVSQ